MKRLIFAAALLFLVPPVQAAEPGLITVKGEATTEFPPDFVRLNVVMSGIDPLVEKAKADVDARTRALLEVIKGFDIQQADMEFGGANIDRSYEYDRNENEKFVGYEVTRSVELKLRKLEAYEPLIGALVKAGANEIPAPTADVDDRNRLKTVALKEATLNAKLKAEEIAKGLGVSVGRPFEVGEERLPSQLPFGLRNANESEVEEIMVTGSQAGIADPLLFVPQNIRVEATVWVSFRIADAEL